MEITWQIKLIIVLSIIIIYLIYRNTVENEDDIDSEENMIMEELNYKVNHVLRKIGHHKKYKLQSHPKLTYTSNKRDIFVCTSCNKNQDDEKLLYMALHETSHALDHSSHSKDSHGEKWERIFKKLLLTAADLGYLKYEGLKFDPNEI